MTTLSIRGAGLALGGGFTMLYLGCAFVMITVPQDVAIHFFNNMFHGVDVTSIMRWNMPFTEIIIGILEVFIVGWLFGAVMAVLYNCGSSKRETDRA